MNTYHVACNIDSKYTRFCGVLMVSLFENNMDMRIRMHILSYKLTPEDKEDLEDIAKKYKNTITFYDVDENVFLNFPVSEKWPVVIYFRLLLPDLISNNIKRVLYVDCDIIFRGPIKELMEIDLSDNVIGAVEDVLSPYGPFYDMLNISPDNYYFNSGMLLIDIDKWKEQQVSKKCIQFIKDNKVLHPDQDALNVVLNTKWKRLYCRWNYLSNYHNSYGLNDFYESDLNKTEKYYPIIIHFSGIKPWQSSCRDPYKKEFFYYQSFTKWKNFIPKHSLKEKIINLLLILMHVTKLRKLNPYYCYD